MHSLHSYFLRPGDPHEEIRYAVDRIRDGRSFSTRRVVAWQHRKGEDVAIFALTADFHAGETAGGRALAADARRARPREPARRWPRWPAPTADRPRCAGRDQPGGRAAVPRGPVRSRRPKTSAGHQDAGPGCGWPAGCPTTRAVHAAALTFVSDLTLLSAGLARLGGGWGAGLRRREPRPRGVVPPAGPRRRVVPLRDRQPGGLGRPGALLRPDLGGRRHARRHRGPGGADPRSSRD